MSVRAMTWAWEQAIPPATKLVLMALADHADNEGVCWPGVRSVAEKTRLSKEAVRYHLRILRRRGLVVSEERVREDGGHTSNTYRLPVNILTHPYQTVDTPPVTVEEGSIKQLIPMNRNRTVREPLPPVAPLKGGASTANKREPPKAKTKPSVSEPFVVRMVQDYSDLWSEQVVRERIAEALNHKAVFKAIDTQRYVQAWLRRDAETAKERRNGQRPQATPRAASPFAKYSDPPGEDGNAETAVRAK